MTIPTSSSPVAAADGSPEPPRDAEEIARLRAELAGLRARLDSRGRRAAVAATLRRVAAAILVVAAALALVTCVVGVWAARTALNTDRWVAAVTPLPRDPQVAAAVSQYATTEVFQLLDVEQRLRTVLPQQAAFVAVPLAGQLREAVRGTVEDIVRSDRFQGLWTELNRRAHQRALAVIEGTSDVVLARRDRVDIDLLPLINQVLRALSAQLPTLFGKQLSLPDLSSGAIPDDLRLRVQDALGVSLPANFAQFAVYDSGRLWAVQRAVAGAKRALVLSVAGAAVLLIAALAVSARRRRTVLQLGVWLVIAAVAVTAVLRAVRREILAEVPQGVYRDGVAAALNTVFGGLRERGVQLIWLGALLAALAYLVGPGRGPVWLRDQARRAAGRLGRAARVTVTRGPGWTGRHLDLLRIAGVAAAAVLALLLSSWTALLVVLLGLTAFEVAITMIARAAGGAPKVAA